MRRVLYTVLMVALLTGCSRDAAETRNPGGNPPTALQGSGVDSPDNTATRALVATDTTGTTTTATATTGTMAPATTHTTHTTTTGAPQP